MLPPSRLSRPGRCVTTGRTVTARPTGHPHSATRWASEEAQTAAPSGKQVSAGHVSLELHAELWAGVAQQQKAPRSLHGAEGLGPLPGSRAPSPGCLSTEPPALCVPGPKGVNFTSFITLPGVAARLRESDLDEATGPQQPQRAAQPHLSLPPPLIPTLVLSFALEALKARKNVPKATQLKWRLGPVWPHRSSDNSCACILSLSYPHPSHQGPSEEGPQPCAPCSELWPGSQGLSLRDVSWKVWAQVN